MVVTAGVVLPAPLWERVAGRAGPETGTTIVPASVFARAVGPEGAGTVGTVLGRSTCPPAAELLGWKS